MGIVDQHHDDHDILLEVLYEIRSRQIESLGPLERRILQQLSPDTAPASAESRGAVAVLEATEESTTASNSPENVLDNDQKAIIEAPPEANLLVNAPPGTGKTFVSVRRIEWLLREGIAASRILVLSFTRTAVSEIQSRLVELEQGFADARGVVVTTLDQRAWRLVHGLQGTGFDILAHGHARSIAEALKLVRSGEASVLQPIEKLHHVIIDEAQDIVAERAEFLLELIARLSPECGVTVLTDDAQAIYAFSTREKSEKARRTLPERLRTAGPRLFQEKTLRTVHRATTPALKFFYTETRDQFLKGLRERTPGLFAFIREAIESSGESMPDDLSRLEGNDEALVLFRNRFEVLRTSGSLYRDGIRHRVRMSKMPRCVHPWVALALSEETGAYVIRESFSARWPSVVNSLGDLAPRENDAWSVLEDVAGDEGRIDLSALRAALSYDRAPSTLCLADLGSEGPVISTIHASKGREAGAAYLFLPTTEPRTDEDEEARVLFVGATRGRRSLYWGRRSPSYDKAVGSTKRRVHFPPSRKGACRLEVGLRGDIDDHSPVALHLQPSAAEARRGQARLARLALERVTAGDFEVRRRTDSRFVIRESRVADGATVASFGAPLVDDLDALRHRTDAAYSVEVPHYFANFPVLGVRTIVLPPDSPAESNLHSPWRRSGFWLAPIVVGLLDVSFSER